MVIKNWCGASPHWNKPRPSFGAFVPASLTLCTIGTLYGIIAAFTASPQLYPHGIDLPVYVKDNGAYDVFDLHCDADLHCWGW
jgi:hypothetical protein